MPVAAVPLQPEGWQNGTEDGWTQAQSPVVQPDLKGRQSNPCTGYPPSLYMPRVSRQ
jgi:hypothetical protein